MELNLLALSIGVGLVVSLVFSELFGLAAGGLVVPGYVALFITRPLDLAATIGAALLTFFLVRIASTFVIVYGRRRTVAMILVGYALGVLMDGAFVAAFESLATDPVVTTSLLPEEFGVERLEIQAGVIGYIVPGLIAIWLDRQGVVPTLSALFTSAVVVRLLLILVVPEEVRWFDSVGSLPAEEQVITR